MYTECMLRAPKKIFIASTLAIFLIFAFCNALGTAYAQSAPNSGSAQEQRAALEAQLEELQKQELEYEKTVQDYQKQGKTLKGEIGTLNTKISQLKLQIKTVTLNLEKLNQEKEDAQKYQDYQKR